MYIIVGLGNPGKKYENTRHNMGFIAIDLLAEEFGIKVDKIKFKALVGEGRIAGQKVVLAGSLPNPSDAYKKQSSGAYSFFTSSILISGKRGNHIPECGV